MSEALTSHNWMKNRIKHTQNIYLLKKKAEWNRTFRAQHVQNCSAEGNSNHMTLLKPVISCIHGENYAPHAYTMCDQHGHSHTIRCVWVLFSVCIVLHICIERRLMFPYAKHPKTQCVCVCVPVVRSSIFVKWMLFLLFPSFFLILANFYT